MAPNETNEITSRNSINIILIIYKNLLVTKIFSASSPLYHLYYMLLYLRKLIDNISQVIYISTYVLRFINRT